LTLRNSMAAGIVGCGREFPVWRGYLPPMMAT